MKLWKLIISIAITSLLHLQDHHGLVVQARSANPRFPHTVKTEAVPKPRRMLMQTVTRKHCSEIIVFQAYTCDNKKCHRACKDSEGVPSNDHDQCLPRENAESPNGKSRDDSGKVLQVEGWDVPPAEKEDDGYIADHEDNIDDVHGQHEKVMVHKEYLLHDEKVQRHPLLQQAMLLSKKEDYPYAYKDADFEVESDDNSEDECCCAPSIPGA